MPADREESLAKRPRLDGANFAQANFPILVGLQGAKPFVGQTPGARPEVLDNPAYKLLKPSTVLGENKHKTRMQIGFGFQPHRIRNPNSYDSNFLLWTCSHPLSSSKSQMLELKSLSQRQRRRQQLHRPNQLQEVELPLRCGVCPPIHLL